MAQKTSTPKNSKKEKGVFKKHKEKTEYQRERDAMKKRKKGSIEF